MSHNLTARQLSISRFLIISMNTDIGAITSYTEQIQAHASSISWETGFELWKHD